MIKKNNKKRVVYSKYLFLLLFLAILVLSVLVIKPFLSTIIVGAVIAYIFRPLYNWFVKKTGMKKGSAIIMLILMLLIIILPFLIVAGQITSESYSSYQQAKGLLIKAQGLQMNCSQQTGFFCNSYNYATDMSVKYNLDFGDYISRGLNSIATFAITKTSNFLREVPSFFLHLFIGLFIVYYMFVDGKDMFATLRRSLPLRKKHRKKIFKEFSDVIYATVYGAIVIAILQGIIATTGYFIFGVSSPLILGLLTMISAFIPFVGAALVWFPASFVMFFNGLLAGNNTVMWKAGGLFLFCLVLVSSIDNILKPKLISMKAKLHPLVVILGVFGGLVLFGFTGIIIGPLLLAMFVTFLRIYEEEKEHFL